LTTLCARQLLPDTDELGSDYPVSVRVDRKLGARDIMGILRDHYEGTPYDLSVGTAGTPLTALTCAFLVNYG
jgi:dipeptidase